LGEVYFEFLICSLTVKIKIKFTVHFFSLLFKLEGVFVAKCLVRHLKLLYSVAPYSRQVLCCSILILILISMYLLTAIGLTPGGSSTVLIYTQTMDRTTQLTTHRTTSLTTKWEECGPCPVFASYTLAFALKLMKKHGKTSVRVAEECQLAR